ncbi:uncharacterized protein [Triticum aestivum]|uniref:uncharacterized protein n=1 Tax=Triticum aestivum TaxID=4565 RepID=UPI001D030EF1|nr:uncharacterized protein LOC123153065 [Triticum aestivum]
MSKHEWLPNDKIHVLRITQFYNNGHKAEDGERASSSKQSPRVVCLPAVVALPRFAGARRACGVPGQGKERSSAAGRFFAAPARRGSVRNELYSRIGPHRHPHPDILPFDIVMCVRAGRYGRLIPLVVNLPHGRNGETLQIVLCLSRTPAYGRLRYPDVHAE